MVSWEEPLFGCINDIKVCFLIAACPLISPCVQGKAVAKATQESCWIPCLCACSLACIGAAINRSRIRDQYLIDGSWLGDCMAHFCCSACAVCQEYREATTREG
jgi:Cys-rich protein (TIGR01571 family)